MGASTGADPGSGTGSTASATTGATSPGELSGQVGIVTGASGSIGRAIALGLARSGMAVAVLGRNRSRLSETLRAVVDGGGRAEALTVDVTDREAVASVVDFVARDLGPVSLLVNAAGRIERSEQAPWETDPGEWWAVIEANLRGPFLLASAVVPRMIASGGGRIVDLNSGFGVRDSAVYSAYCASKAALARLGGSLAAAGAEHGVRSFQVAPGLVRSDMTAGMAMHADVPDERWTPVEQVVDLVVAIAEGRLDRLTGRYFRAGADDIGELRAWADWIVEKDARTLQLRPYGDDDPLA